MVLLYSIALHVVAEACITALQARSAAGLACAIVSQAPNDAYVALCSGVLRAIAQAGGAALWANAAKGYEEAVQLCLAHLEDVSRATGDAFAGALGDLVSASKSAAALQAV